MASPEAPLLDARQSIVALESSEGVDWLASAERIDPAALQIEFQNRRDSLRGAPGNWVQAQVPGNALNDLKLAHGVREIWLAFSFRLRRATAQPLVISLGNISDIDQAFLNGVALGQTGDFASSRPQAYDRLRLYPVPENVLLRDRSNLVLIRVRSYFPHEAGIIRGTLSIGPAKLQYQRFYLGNLVQGLFLMLYVSVGAYFAFLFLRRQQNRENLFFALACFGLVGYQFLRLQLKYFISDDLFMMKRMEYITLYTIPNFLYYFLRYSFRLPPGWAQRWLDRGMLALAGVHVALALFIAINDDVVAWDYWNRRIAISSWVIFYAPAMLALISYQAFWRKERDARYLLAGLATFVVGVGIDATGHLLSLPIPRFMGYLFLLFILSIALILANRFVRLNEEVEDLNRNLEKKVADRTEELARSLREVRALKEQQDGDYFLTSLLIRPLSGGAHSSELVRIDTRTFQKKRFRFRHWEADIGGDLCVRADVHLRGRHYTAFLNGDAMGKSIQGAGGALVLGALFKSILSRTAMRESIQQRSPEQWLREGFLEMHDVFLNFDGYMLVSMAMGLIDERSGLIYYINAEHPPAVLLRRGRARFLERAPLFRKLGIDLDRPFHLRTFQLRPDDILILGSDGRDDLIVGRDAQGNRRINEDETLFLRAAEHSGGDLDALLKRLETYGEFSDDISLMRISYREGAPPPLPDQAASGARRKALQLALRSRDFVRAAELLRAEEESAAADYHLLMLAGRCLLRAGQVGQARDYFERARIQRILRWRAPLYQFLCDSLLGVRSVQEMSGASLKRDARERNVARAERMRAALQARGIGVKER
ncbi:MAG: SpoIIE family protein phosphatase [Leptospirales bacterium]|nr:SpoIIE family protein phosphatase [Leptospirales bacterium]